MLDFLKKYCKVCKERVYSEISGRTPPAKEFADGLYCEDCAKQKKGRN